MQHDVLDGMFTFYDSKVSTLQIYQVKLAPRSFFHFFTSLTHRSKHTITWTNFFKANHTITLTQLQVASVTFDLLLLLGLGSYLITLFSLLVITTRVCIIFLITAYLRRYYLGDKTLTRYIFEQGLDDLISLFRRPPSRKVKSV